MSDTRIVHTTAARNFAVGKMSFDLDFLPSGYVIDSADVELSGTLNVPAAGVTSEQLTRLVSAIESARRLRTDGVGSSAGDWQVQGRDLVTPAAIAVGAAQPIATFWPLSWADKRAIEPKEPAPLTDFYKGQTLDVFFADPATIVAALAVNVGTTVQITFRLSKASPGNVPPSVVIGYQEYTGQEIKLPRGHYVDIYIRKATGAAITEAELGNVRLSEDGKTDIINRQRLPQLVRSFNRYIADGAQVETPATGIEGEALDEAAVPFAPILHPMKPYKVTQLPLAKESMNLTIDGTLAVSSARVYYRYIEYDPQGDGMRKGAAKLGLDATATPEPKTASKRGVSPVRGFLSGIAHRFPVIKR